MNQTKDRSRIEFAIPVNLEQSGLFGLEGISAVPGFPL